jgi:lysozyme family protein
MPGDYDAAFSFVVGAEGGFGRDPHDKGNWTGGKVGKGELRGTKYGISAMSYPEEDIPNLTLATAKLIYWQDYYTKMRCDIVAYPKAICIFDCAVNQGCRRAAKFVQEVVGTTPDGIIGGHTVAALNSMRDSLFVESFLERREEYYMSLKTFGRYGEGWLNRLDHVRKEALGV